MSGIDVTEQTFQTEVIERSRSVPVVVDFWAAWCGPCRALTPILESVASRREGQVVLAKIDTDANQGLAATYGIQGIPAVKAFRDGEVVNEFVGVQPPAAVERFFDSLVPSEAEGLVSEGGEEALRRALELEPNRADAALALARLLLDRGERDEARRLLEGVVGNFQAEGLAARLRLQDESERDDALAGTLAPAFAALDEGDTEGGLDLLLAALGSVDGHRDDVRRVIVGELDALGSEHPLARESRRRLATALY
jgi:putative thioredoxin